MFEPDPDLREPEHTFEHHFEVADLDAYLLDSDEAEERELEEIRDCHIRTNIEDHDEEW